MTFLGAIHSVLFEKYAQFSGRATRAELWYFVAFLLLIVIGFATAFTLIGGKTWLIDAAMKLFQNTGHWPQTHGPTFALAGTFTLFFLSILIPSLAVMTRRFHDAGWSGWWIALIVIGRVTALLLPYPANLYILFGFGLFFLIIASLPSQPHTNRYGDVPEFG